MVRVIADNAYSMKYYGSSNIIKKTKIANHSFLLYVDDPPKSAEFNEKLLRAKPVEAAPGYAMFALTAPTMLGLRKCADVLPK